MMWPGSGSMDSPDISRSLQESPAAASHKHAAKTGAFFVGHGNRQCGNQIMNALQYYVNCFNHRLSRPLSSIWTSRVTRNGQIFIRLKFMVIASVDVLSDDDVGVQSPQSAPSTSAPPAPAGSPPVAGPVKPDAKAEKAAAAKVLSAAKKQRQRQSRRERQRLPRAVNLKRMILRLVQQKMTRAPSPNRIRPRRTRRAPRRRRPRHQVLLPRA